MRILRPLATGLVTLAAAVTPILFAAGPASAADAGNDFKCDPPGCSQSAGNYKTDAGNYKTDGNYKAEAGNYIAAADFPPGPSSTGEYPPGPSSTGNY
jgi:hypothetical protein